MQATRPLRKPTKQRRMLFQAPDHIRHRMLAAHLSPELRASHGAKSFPVRTGDTVHVMRGDHRGVEGKINRVNLAKYRVYVEGLTREKVDGTTIFVPIHPSKVMITHLNLDDKWRKEILETKKQLHRKLEKAVEKPAAKLEEEPRKVEELKKVEEKPVLKEKVPKKRAAKERKKVPGKTPAKKTKKETEEPQKEEKTKPTKRARRTRRKSATEAEEGEK